MQTTFQTPGGVSVELATDEAGKLTIAENGEVKNFRTAAIVDGWIAEPNLTARCLKVCFGPLNVGTLYQLPSDEAEDAVQSVLNAAA